MQNSASTTLRSQAPAAAVVAVLALGSTLALSASRGTPVADLLVGTGLVMVTLAGGVAALLRSRSATGRDRHLWRCAGAGALCWAVAGAAGVWRAPAAGGPAVGHLPTTLGLCAAAGALAVAALVPALRRRGTRPVVLRDVLDGALVTGSVGASVWSVTAPAANTAATGPTGTTGTAAVVLAVLLTAEVILVLVALLSAARHRRRSAGPWLLTAGLATAVAADLAAAVLGARQQGDLGGATTWAWFLAMVLVLGAASRRPELPPVEGPPRPRAGLTGAAVLLGLAVLLQEELPGGRDEPGTAWLHAAVLVLLAARTLLAVHQSDHLAHGLQRWVTDRARDMAASQRRSAALVSHSADLVAVLDGDGVFVYASPSAEQLLGRTPEELAGTPLTDLLTREEARGVLQALSALTAGPGTSRPVHLTAHHARGRKVVLESLLTDLRHDPAVRGVVLNGRDVTDALRLEAELSRQAFRDTLTGLPNRALFQDRLQHALASRRDRGPVKVCYLDLDGFKAVNDSLGHGAGDELLVLVAGRLKAVLREGDTVARLGGDEFVILLEETSRPEDAQRLAQRVCEAVRHPFEIRGVEVRVAASVGLASTRTAGHDAEQLMRAADLAMYHAKGERRGGYAVYHPDMHQHLLDRVEMEADLHRAVEGGQFRVVYQPLVDMASQAVSGVEALVRWDHPVRGVVAPTAFIPVAESAGLVGAIGEFVLREACATVAGWRRDVPGAESVRVSVNVSGYQLRSPELVDVVAGVLEQSGLPASALVLEITETVFVDQDEVSLDALHALRALGVRLAIDDFGTGYSSLSYLHRLPVDILKIDKSFVDELSPTGDLSLVDAIIGMAGTLGLATVAEGVEHEHQRVALEAQGCATGQGYHFSPPVGPELVPELILAALGGGSALAGASAPATSPEQLSGLR